GGPDWAPVDAQSGALAVRQSCGWRDEGRRCLLSAKNRRPTAGAAETASAEAFPSAWLIEPACGRERPYRRWARPRTVPIRNETAGSGSSGPTWTRLVSRRRYLANRARHRPNDAVSGDQTNPLERGAT